MATHRDDQVRSGSRGTDAIEFRLLTIATYPVFLAIALGRLVTGHRPAGRPRSIFATARADASTAIALAFMG